MKFLFIAPRFHTNLYYRVKSLQDAGNSVKIFVLYKGKSEFTKGLNIQVFRLSFFTILFEKLFSFFNKNKLKTSLELRLQIPNKKFKTNINLYKPDVIFLKAFQNLLAIKTLFIVKKCKLKFLC